MSCLGYVYYVKFVVLDEPSLAYFQGFCDHISTWKRSEMNFLFFSNKGLIFNWALWGGGWGGVGEGGLV